MILPILFITACVTNADSNILCDERYCLYAVEPLQYVNSFEDAKAVCNASLAWLLEIYDESVWKLFQNLKAKIQNVDWFRGTLLGMKQSNNGWQWINNKLYDEGINTNSYQVIKHQTGLSNKFVRAVLTSENDIQYEAADIYSHSNYVICSKEKTASICPVWEYNGLCFYAIWISNTWYQAHNMCIQNQSSMATFNNIPWNKEYSSNLLTNNILTNGYWIGLTRNTWKWLHSDTFVTYNKWLNFDMNNMYTYVDKDGSWISTDWQSVSKCVLVCMSNSKVSTTKSTVQDVDKNSSPSPSTTSVAIVDHPHALSIGAKAGIGVGVSMLFIIIIIIVGVLIFKYFHHFKKTFQRKKSKTATGPEDTYSVVANNNRQTISPDITSHQLEYADLDFKKHFEDNIKSENY